MKSENKPHGIDRISPLIPSHPLSSPLIHDRTIKGPYLEDCKPKDRTPERNPVLNNPYEFPTEYWELDSKGRATANLLKGRRPSAPYPTVPQTGVQTRKITDSDKDMHRRINLIRDRVEAWRQDGYPGIKPNIIKLLNYWRGEEQYKIRPFFCQIVAIETIIWLCDGDESTDPLLSNIRREISEACQKHNGDDILRYATKMATGTGKTMVMAMLIVWQAMRKQGRTDILIMVPNLTVKDRLQVLIPNEPDNMYKDILPRNQKLPEDIKVSIVNYQAFQLRSSLGVNPEESVDAKTRRLITAGQGEPSHWKETPVVMLDRVLSSHKGADEIIVINDEAHHCYRPDDPDAKANKAEVVNPKDAALWFSTLSYLSDVGRLGMVFDMSATPMFISSASKTDTELFPWAVSDYPLIDAIEAGLVKIPRVPVEDLTGFDEPKFRNIFQYIRKADRKLRHDDMNEDVKDLLVRLETKYKIETERYAKNNKIPVMIVVAYPIENAKAIFKHLAGYKDGETWKGGYEMFSNIKDGKPVVSPNTLLVTSEMDDLDDRDWKELMIDWKTFSPKGMNAKERANHIRDVFQTVGQKGKPGENIRCVVSVNMLTEGWDARTVTHIFGYRAFKSDLLCEQVAGRALRRSNLPAAGLKPGELLPPEYAGIFGIPFSFMLGSGENGENGSLSWNVKTLEGREQFRMTFPNVYSYEINPEDVTLILDKDKVRPYKPEKLSDRPGHTTVMGPTGEEDVMRDSKRAQTAIYQLAEHVTRRYGGPGVGKTPFFKSALLAVHEWLDHPNVECNDPIMVSYNPNLETAAEAVYEASVTNTDKPPILPIFADEKDSSQEHEFTTEGVDFDTTLINKYPPSGGIPAKSEISAAACDSTDEVRVAEILDAHDGIEAWIRNERIGWSIPYIDPKVGGWREYKPDFVARINGGKCHLVIEYKGQDTHDAQVKKKTTEEKWIPAVNNSEDLACAGKWKYVYLDTPARIGKDLDDAITEMLSYTEAQE